MRGIDGEFPDDICLSCNAAMLQTASLSKISTMGMTQGVSQVKAQATFKAPVVAAVAASGLKHHRVVHEEDTDEEV